MTKIEVFGTGCTKCKKLERLAQQAVLELGMDIEVVKIENIKVMMDRGIFTTPALYIDGEPKAVGRVPSVDEIKEMLIAK
ncbi:MAG: thioredoxin family protein [Euryarchaeota archaeon]|nr:thioredoxin family protein [Euryarchaeota archaeon]